MAKQLTGRFGFVMGSDEYFRELNNKNLMGKLMESNISNEYGKAIDALCKRARKAIDDIHADLAQYVESLRFFSDQERSQLRETVKGFEKLFTLGSCNLVNKADGCISMLNLRSTKSKKLSGERQSVIDDAVKLLRSGGKVSMGKMDRFRVIKKAVEYGAKNITNSKDKQFYDELIGNRSIEFAKDVYHQANFMENKRDFTGKCYKVLCSNEYLYYFEKEVFGNNAVDYFKGKTGNGYYNQLLSYLKALAGGIERDLDEGEGQITSRNYYKRLENSAGALDRMTGSSIKEKLAKVNATPPTYDRLAAVDYMRRYYQDYNPDFLAMDHLDDAFKYFTLYTTITGFDCANFVSQGLLAGGVPMNEDWYFHHVQNMETGLFPQAEHTTYRDTNNTLTERPEDYLFSGAWSMANAQFRYFSDPVNGYIEGEPILIRPHSTDDIQKAIEQGVQIGDLLYWDWKGQGIMGHATMITGVKEQDLLYGGHTASRIDASLYYGLIGSLEDKPDAVAYIVKLRDDIVK